MRMGRLLQRKGPGKGTSSLSAPSRKPSLLSRLILAPAICSYHVTTFFTAFMSICGTPVGICRFPKQSPRTDGQPYGTPGTDPDWSARLWCSLLTPLGPRAASANCLGLIFPSQRSFAQVRLDRLWQSTNGSLRPGPKSLTVLSRVMGL